MNIWLLFFYAHQIQHEFMHLGFDAILKIHAYFITYFTCLTHAYFLLCMFSATLLDTWIVVHVQLLGPCLAKLKPIHLIRPPFWGRLGSGFKQRRCKGSSCAWKNLGSLGGGGPLHCHHSIKCTWCRKNGYLCSEAHNLSGRSELNWPLRRKDRNKVSAPIRESLIEMI